MVLIGTRQMLSGGLWTPVQLLLGLRLRNDSVQVAHALVRIPVAKQYNLVPANRR